MCVKEENFDKTIIGTVPVNSAGDNLTNHFYHKLYKNQKSILNFYYNIITLFYLYLHRNEDKKDKMFVCVEKSKDDVSEKNNSSFSLLFKKNGNRELYAYLPYDFGCETIEIDDIKFKNVSFEALPLIELIDDKTESSKVIAEFNEFYNDYFNSADLHSSSSNNSYEFSESNVETIFEYEFDICFLKNSIELFSFENSIKNMMLYLAFSTAKKIPDAQLIQLFTTTFKNLKFNEIDWNIEVEELNKILSDIKRKTLVEYFNELRDSAQKKNELIKNFLNCLYASFYDFYNHNCENLKDEKIDQEIFIIFQNKIYSNKLL